MITVFLSPLVSKALRRMRANSSKASSGTAERLIGDQAYDSESLGPRSGGPLRHRDDRTASRSTSGTHSGWLSLAALPQALASGATFCLAPSLSSAGHPLGVPRRKLLRHGTPRLHANPVQMFIRVNNRIGQGYKSRIVADTTVVSPAPAGRQLIDWHSNKWPA
jgi:hypothetical protein